MLQEELTFQLISKGTGISYEQIPKLWHAFLQQMEQRLSNGSSIDMEGLGFWSLRLRDEFVAEIQGQGTYIIPPSLSLELSPTKGKEEQCYSLMDFQESLVLATKLSKETTHKFLKSLAKILEDKLKEKGEILCPKIGTLSLIEAKEGFSYKLALNQAFAESLNKPFMMFSPIELQELDKENLSIELRSVSTWEEVGLAIECYYKQKEDIPIEDNETMEEENTNLDLGSVGDEEYVVPITENEDLTLPKEERETELPKGEETLDLGALPEEEDVKEEKKRRGWFFYLVLLTFLLALSYGLILLFQNNKNWISSGKDLQQESIRKPKAELRTSIKADSIKKDSIKPVEEQPKAEVEKYKEIKIRSGHTLRKIALKEYGHKIFWVYIYEENKAIIKNPNNVAIGTKLRIPDKSKYGIDANDNNSIKKALKLEQKIFNELK